MKKLKEPIRILPNNSVVGWHGFMADTGGCGFHRMVFPSLLTSTWKLSQNNIKFFPSYGMKYILDPSFYKDKLYVVFQRSATDQQKQLFDYFKTHITPKTGTRVVYEIDDDLINIPQWNMASDYYSKNREHAMYMIKNADGITVSTDHLKKVLIKYNSNIVVNQNHLPKFIWGDVPEITEMPDRPKILWMGSSNHFAIKSSGLKGGDFGEGLLNYIKETLDIYEWCFIGALPNELAEAKDKISWYSWQNILSYPHFIKSLNADIGIAPLYDHKFNRSKSNLKAMEYVASGIPGIYTDIIPYQGLKNTCSTDDEFISKIEEMVHSDDLRKETQEHDYQVLHEGLFWEENQNIRKYINNNLSLFKMRLPDNQ